MKSNFLGNVIGWSTIVVVAVGGIYILSQLAERFWYWTSPR